MKILKIKEYDVQLSEKDYEKFKDQSFSVSQQINGRVYFQLWNKGTYKCLHRLIAGAKSDEIVDHINQNTLDNRPENLRCVTKSANALNTKLRSDNTTGYRGVTEKKDGRKKKWKASVCYQGKLHHLGNFYSAIEAARAYDSFWQNNYPNELVYKNFEDIV